ncbi:MAG: pilus assembly protein TadG-related protein [Pikeienuella sp.]
MICLRFMRETTASMATQVVIFSILLFGASGLVLDFGRIYAEHSRMQSFTDQAALAAAAELDQGEDAIQRAARAVFGENGAVQRGGAAVFSEGESGGFRISHLFFLSDLSADDGAQYDLTDDIAGPHMVYAAEDDRIGDDARIASTQAKFVIAVAEERSVRNTLLRLINAAGEAVVDEAAPLRTVAAARRKRLSCGALSNLVICNPWERDPGASFQSEMSAPEAIGRQFRLVADAAGRAPGETPAPDALSRRLALEAPAAVEAICANPRTMPGADPAMSPEEAGRARAICMLASAREPTYCTDDEITVIPAPPEEIATALGVAFDIWDDPIAGVLAWDRDGEGDHSQAVSRAGRALFNRSAAHFLRDRSPLFQPDLDIFKGRVWDEPTAIANRGRGLPDSSRLNYPRTPDYAIRRLMVNPCIRAGVAANCETDSEGRLIEHLAQPANRFRVAWYFQQNFPRLYMRDMLRPPAHIVTFYDAYRLEREDWLHAREDFITLDGELARAGSPLTLTGEDGSLDTRLGPPHRGVGQIQTRPAYDDSGQREDVNGDGEIDDKDVERAYSNYTYNPPANPIDRDLERRVFNATVVNCGAMRDEKNMGEQAARAEVAGFARLFLLQPPDVRCPDGTENCMNRDLNRAAIFAEFIGLPSMTETAYAVLAR